MSLPIKTKQPNKSGLRVRDNKTFDLAGNSWRKLMKRPILLSLVALSFAFTQPALAAHSDLETGIQLYKQGKYELALSYLNAAATGRHARSAEAHYYLANTLLRTHRQSAATREYQEAYRLDPRGAFGKHALKALQRTTPSSSGTEGEANTAADRTGTSTEAQHATRKQDLANEASLATKLPKIPKFAAEPTSPASILLWTPNQLANFVQNAHSRVERARLNLTEAQDVLKKAESLTYSLMPSTRAFGESEEHLNERRIAARNKIDEILKPYQKEVEHREKLLAQETQLYDKCVLHYRTLYGVVPPILHIGTPFTAN